MVVSCFCLIIFWYHFCPHYVIYEWDEFFEKFMEGIGELHFGHYFDHVLSWAHKDDVDVLFLKYEDMKKDFPSWITQFIGQDVSKELVHGRDSTQTLNVIS